MPTPNKLLTKEAIAKFEREKKRGFPEKADATRQQSSQMKQKVEQQAKQGTKRLTQQRADRAYNEIESRRKRRDAGITVNNQPVSQRSSDAYAATHGEIKDGNQAQLDNAMAQWGLHSGLGQMTNISDQWRATPSFANFVGRSTPEAMAMAGSLVANPVGTILGMGTGYLGSQVGGYVGEQLGNRGAGEITGSLVGMPFGFKIGNTLQRTVPNYYRNYTLARAINQGVRETELPITRRTISVNRSNNPVQQQPDLVYTLYNEFGEPIGQTNVGGAVFGSGDKSHRMIDGVMSMRNAHKVSEDTYNTAVQDILEGGGKGLESGWSLMSPQKTLAVTKKFPHEVIGQEFGNPVRLLTGTTNRPIPTRVKGNHYQEVKPQYEIVYNETTGDFERVPIEKIVNTEGLYNHPGAFLGNTATGGITVNGQRVLRKPYQTPDIRRVLLTTREPLMVMNEPLPKGLASKGWTLAEDGAFMDPQGIRFVRNAEGKLQSESSLKETIKTKISQQNRQKELSLQRQQEQQLQKIIDDFENHKIIGFSINDWQTMRKGFKTTDKDIKEYKSHLQEYHDIFKSLLENGDLSDASGRWEGNVNGKMIPVNPRQYIIAHSKNFTENGWKYDGINRGTSMYPETALEIQNNGGLGAANWTTTNNSQLSIFSHQRGDGPTLRGIVSMKTKPDRTSPVRYAHEANNESYKGITDFEGPIEYPKGTKSFGLWRLFGPDMRIKAIDGNTGLFSKTNNNPLNTIIPPFVGGSILLTDNSE